MNLTWRTTPLLNCLHAADLARRRQPRLPDDVRQALAEPLRALDEALAEERVPADAFWARVIPLAVEFTAPRQLAEVTLIKVIGKIETPIRVPRFERCLTALRDAFRTAPSLGTEELTRLSQPLRDEWNRVGPGLLSQMKQETDDELLVDQAAIVLTPPWTGGCGYVHLAHNLARIEASEDEREVLRLAWLLGQLNLDVPRFSEQVTPARRERVAALAMTPVTLSAAESSRLASGDLAWALATWLDDAASERIVADWWEVYRGQRPSWAAALQALDRMLGQ